MLTSRIWAALAVAALSTSVGAVPTKLSADAGEVRDIVFASGTTLYAATQGGGVFKSTDSGATWAATALNTGYVWRIAISHVAPTTALYAATDAGLFRSLNSGASWTQLTFDPARAVAVDPNSAGNDLLLLGVPGRGILRSTDAGATWTRQSTGLDSSDVTQIFIRTTPSGEAFVLLNCNSDDAIFPYEAGNWGGVFRTTSLAGTISWVSYQAGGGTPLPSKCVRSIAGAASTSVLLAGIQDPFDGTGQIYKTTGAGWAAVRDLFGIESLNPSAASATTFYAGTRGVGVWGSSDSGTTWAQNTNYGATDSDLRNRNYAIASTTSSLIVMASGKGLGILRSTNYTAGGVGTWSVAPGLKADRVRALDNHRNIAPGTYWMGLEGGGVVKSTNSGGTWSSLLTGLDLGASSLDTLPTIAAIGADPNNTAVVLVGARPYGLFQLSGGTSWTTAGLPTSVISSVTPTVVLPDYKPQFLLMASSTFVFYTLFDGVSTVAGGLLRSTTGPSGITQTNYPAAILNCTLSTAQAAATKVIFTNTATYLLRHDSSMPYRSTDLFATGAAPCVNVTHEGYERVTFYDIAQNPVTNATNVAATSKGIFRSSDDGQNWGRLTVSGLPAQVLSSLRYNGTILYGVDRGGHMSCSTDDGSTWQPVSLGGLAPVAFRDLRFMNGSLHAVSDGGGVYNGFAATCP